MKVTFEGTVLADATGDQIVTIEGNPYFAPSSLTAAGNWQDSPTPYTCPWKGVAQYHTVTVGDETINDVAWSYPHPDASAIARVGSDFSGYLAFDKSKVAIG